MKKGVVILSLFFAGLLLFMPKLSLWYGLLHQLEKDQIILLSEHAQERAFSLRLRENTLYHAKKRVAQIASIKWLPLLLYNSIEMEDITPTTAPKWHIESAKLTYSILDPTYVGIVMRGDFGLIEGRFDLRRKHLSLEAKVNQRFHKSRWFRKYFKHGKDGYHYAADL